MSFLAGTDRGDLRKVEVAKLLKQNQIAMKLNSKADKLYASIWDEKQKELMPNSLPITNQPTLAMLLTEDNQRIISDTELMKRKALENLLKIAQPVIAEYILDQLDDEDIKFMNQMFASLVEKVRQEFTNGVDKNVLVNIIKNSRYFPSALGLNATTREQEQAEFQPPQQPVQPPQQPVQEPTPKRREPTPKRRKPTPKRRVLTPKRREPTPKRREPRKPKPPVETPEDHHHPRRGRPPKKRPIDEINFEEGKNPNPEEELIIHTPLRRKIDKGEGFTTTKRGKKRIIKGCGMKQVTTSTPNTTKSTQRHYIKHFYIDLRLLNQNILCAKYAKNDASVPSLRRERISDDAKAVIKDIIDDHFNERLFEKLEEADQRLIKRFVNALKLDIALRGESDELFQKRYDVLVGEWNSGNDSPELKRELRQYILQALNENLITKSQGYNLLYSLSL